jgi:hypothetical protein
VQTCLYALSKITPQQIDFQRYPKYNKAPKTQIAHERPDQGRPFPAEVTHLGTAALPTRVTAMVVESNGCGVIGVIE